MSLKVKLITSISAFFLVLALLVTGVFAARNLEFTFGGTINFEGVNGNVDALITAEVTGTSTPITLDPISIEQGDTEVTVPDSWQNLDLTFNENVENIILSFTVTNRREDRGLSCSLYAKGIIIEKGGTLVSDEPFYGKFSETAMLGTVGEYTFGDFRLASGENKTFSFSLIINDKFSPIDNTNIDFKFLFSDRDPSLV